ncbi:hypothetical protein EGJ27_14095 [Pseudomonas sp. v388]|uniref:hypothetical protein n=1 Tax=Pseudomonas sp. v388 TaxID=2479849 RepID=UPI000F782CE3|nr:hypothetical protein [Pseudomonas sp. v388]RRV06881.1 hypothetical protein EGJ27_14095 [Pseudomonas sp. v388]
MTDRKPSRSVVLKTGLALLACLLQDISRPAHADEVDDTALTLVRERQLGDSLGWLGYQVASRTVTFASLVETLGKTQAQELVQRELQRLQPEFQGQWDRNLAAAYAHAFTAQELRSLNAGDDSPALANKFKALNSEVGADMKARSADLLGRFVSQALGNAQRSLDH